ncbi:glutathione S-transferase family protein [Sphingomonas sp. RB56-2]|uniref:Glutathione S-transferase family protein n=1 Tax=Sphingomonas brevis TaxID=2908206 RepID=A0ABT0S5N5_9SPHN|nr:glutathione S-transferase family protein [Sphingomonas brevis]MCL6739713.1 glutathione S-transferase family protein [Sphingomonas brevis]
MKIIGSFVSPYVRKVLVCMELKGLDYEVDPITPFFGNDEFRRLSPLCRIPVLIDGDLVLTDSTVIAEYLDEAYPDPRLMPMDPRERARARWLEEFADTRLGDVFIWGLFYPKMVHPRVWGEPGDQARIDKSLNTDIPAALDYLENELPQKGYVFGEMGLADISIASFFRNASYAGFVPDHSRWPRTAQLVERVLAHPAFEKIHKLEMIQLSASIEGRRQALLDAGAKLTAETYGQREARKGVMRL